MVAMEWFVACSTRTTTLVYTDLNLAMYFRNRIRPRQAQVITPGHELELLPNRYNWRTTLAELITIIRHCIQGSQSCHQSLDSGSTLTASPDDLYQTRKRKLFHRAQLSVLRISHWSFGTIYRQDLNDGNVWFTSNNAGTGKTSLNRRSTADRWGKFLCSFQFTKNDWFYVTWMDTECTDSFALLIALQKARLWIKPGRRSRNPPPDNQQTSCRRQSESLHPVIGQQINGPLCYHGWWPITGNLFHSGNSNVAYLRHVIQPARENTWLIGHDGRSVYVVIWIPIHELSKLQKWWLEKVFLRNSFKIKPRMKIPFGFLIWKSF